MGRGVNGNVDDGEAGGGVGGGKGSFAGNSNATASESALSIWTLAAKALMMTMSLPTMDFRKAPDLFDLPLLLAIVSYLYCRSAPQKNECVQRHRTSRG